MGRKIDLEDNREYVIGRADDCDIRVDRSDMTASRKHARVFCLPKTITLESLSQTNPVVVKGKPVQSAVLRHKDEFQVGASLFRIEKIPASGATKAVPGKISPKIVLLSLILILAIGFVFLRGSGDKQETQAPAGQPQASQEQKPFIGVRPSSDPSVPGQVTGMAVSEADRNAADQHFRQGMFFYEANKLPRALEEWSSAINAYPDHPDARVWFLRAEQELEEQIRGHYQNAMTHYRYMRYSEAAHEFRIVIQLSRNKTSDIYTDALRYLNELQGK